MAGPEELPEPKPEKPKGRKPYASPRLQEFGDLRELTLGASPGTTDSGGEGKASLG